MHEYSLIQALVSRVDDEVRKRGAAKVHRLRVRLGELSGVDPALFVTAYETFRAGTVCADAALDLATVPARWRCPKCDRSIAKGEKLQCCGAPARLAEGDDLLLDQIELEVA
jgi:hydrogenase nickel incorporation protein HypA/HybF